MRPKRYPYSGKIKASTTDIVKDWEKTYSDFVAEMQSEQDQSEQKLLNATERVDQLESQVHQFVLTKCQFSD